MRASPKTSAFLNKLIEMENGFNNFPVANAQLTVGRESMTPAEVVQRFQGIVTIIQDVQATQVAHQAAAKACEKAMPSAHAFYEQTIAVVKAHFGSDAKILATFGLGKARKPSKQMPMVVVEEVVLPEREDDANADSALASSVSNEREAIEVEVLAAEPVRSSIEELVPDSEEKAEDREPLEEPQRRERKHREPKSKAGPEPLDEPRAGSRRGGKKHPQIAKRGRGLPRPSRG